jgi:hypothetical protein
MAELQRPVLNIKSMQVALRRECQQYDGCSLGIMALCFQQLGNQLLSSHLLIDFLSLPHRPYY